MKNKKITTISILIVASVLIYFLFPNVRIFLEESISNLVKGDIALVRDYLLSFGVWAPIVSIFLMVLSVLIAPIPAFIPTFTNGLLFGTFFGLLLSWVSALLGATLAYYIAKNLGRPVVEKLVSVKALDWTDVFIQKFGLYSVVIARLVPVFSYGIVSYAVGLTRIKYRTYIIGTAIGQTPATILYSYLGQNANESIWMMYLALAIVVLISITAPFLKAWIEKMRNKK